MATLEHEAVTQLAVRLSRAQAERLERAASLTGQSLNEFAASALLGAADAALAAPPVTVLSNRDFDRLMALSGGDVEPNETLRAAAAEYGRRLAEGSLQVED